MSHLPRSTEPADRPTIRVLLDGRKIEGGGIGVYIKNLISGLTALPFVDLTVLVHPGKSEIALKSGAQKTIEDRAKLYSMDELFFLRNRIAFSNYDIFHTPHYTLPFRIPIPTVVTIHDTIHVSHAEKFYYPFIARRLIRSALRRATKVITVSESTRRSLEGLLPRAAEKIEVVPNAVDPIYLIETCLGEAGAEDRPRGEYLMAVFSNAKPHKGLDDLMQAFAIAGTSVETLDVPDKVKKTIRDLRLVLVGTGTEHLKGGSLDPKIHVAGTVSSQELQRLYSQAQCLVVSSLVEGFCLPVIESQACATPVIARPAPAVLELMTTNDHVCRDLSVESLAEAIIEFFRKRIEKPELIDYGVPLDHMRRFCREDVSRSVTDVYQAAMNIKG